MPASEKELETDIGEIKLLGIIAGGGSVPEALVRACDEKGIEVFIVGFEDQTNPLLLEGRSHMWGKLGSAGQIIKTLKSHGVRDLVLIGSLRRPSLSELRPDLKTAEFFAKIGFKALGDDGLLCAVRDTLAQEGFRMHGVHKFAEELLAPEGAIGRYEPKQEDWGDIRRGFEVSQAIGHMDVGQSVIIQEGIVIGVEAIEGTDALMERCRYLFRKGRKPVLVKTCKPGQDYDFDLPTIGPDTVEKAHEYGLGGVVVHAGQSLIYDRQGVEAAADKHKIFVYGLSSE